MERMKVEGRDISSEKVRIDNVISIASANQKRAVAVVVDPKKLVNKDGSPVDLSHTKAIKMWLRGRYRNIRVVISDDGQIVEFTTKGFGSDQKRKIDRSAQRQVYADLDSIVENSIYYGYELGDARHEYVERQKTYYGLASIDGQYYGVRLKIDLHKNQHVGFYKDLEVAKIKSPSLLHGGSRRSDPLSHQEGDAVSISIPEIVRAFTI